MPTADEWMDTVIRRAAELRKAGVTTVAIDGCSVTLAPEAAPIDITEHEVVAEADADPLNSPATYADGRVPGFERPKMGDA